MLERRAGLEDSWSGAFRKRVVRLMNKTVQKKRSDQAIKVDLRLPSSARAAGMARHAILPLRKAAPDVVEDVLLLVTELVTNSYRHSGATRNGWIDLHVTAGKDLVRVEVADEGRGFRASRRSGGADVSGGWGLHLIEHLTDRWGVSSDGHTCVWFEIDRDNPREDEGA